MAKINYVKLSNAKLLELAKERDLSLPEDASREELIAALKEAEPKEGKAIFYWVKFPSYVSDTEMIEPGLYRTDKPIQRLDASKSQYVERFDEEVPEVAIYEIAKQFRVATEGDGRNKFRDFDEILEELVTDR